MYSLTLYYLVTHAHCPRAQIQRCTLNFRRVYYSFHGKVAGVGGSTMRELSRTNFQVPHCQKSLLLENDSKVD